MLVKTSKYDDQEILIANSGIQFLDVDLDLTDRNFTDLFNYQFFKRDPGQDYMDIFVRKDIQEEIQNPTQEDKETLISLLDKVEVKRSEEYRRIDITDSLDVFADEWLPIPFFQIKDDKYFCEGPVSWSRLYIKKIENNKYRLVFAFDTQVYKNDNINGYILPTPDDVHSGARFPLCSNFQDLKTFIKTEIVSTWLEQVWLNWAEKNNISRAKRQEQYENNKYFVAHYLNVIYALLMLNKHKCESRIPEIKLINFDKNDEKSCVNVDLVLDVGNSRTCGLMLENYSGCSASFSNVYKLTIRDLSHPEQTYDHAFASRIEFSIPSFNKNYYRALAGYSPFQWPSMVRVGDEAEQLSWRQNGTEGNSGITSPKHYLWSDEPNNNGWILNSVIYPTSTNEPATIPPIADFVQENGRATFTNKNSVGVYQPNYSKQSTMTFMICEILAQACSQMNSIYQRKKVAISQRPRRLNSIILTVPPAMPKQEISRYITCVNEAIGIFWKAMKWDKSDFRTSLDFKNPLNNQDVWPPIPKVKVDWDEAICGQVVYLFNELNSKYKGHFEHFLQSVSRSNSKDKLTLATIDIGGGTSDIVVNEYTIVSDTQVIQPKQLFRESFKTAGDDILLQIIREYVVESIKTFVKQQDVIKDKEIDDLLTDLLGPNNIRMDQKDKTLRKHAVAQIFVPLAESIIAAYSKYGTEEFKDISNQSFGKALKYAHNDLVVTDSVIQYLSQPLAKLLRKDNFSVLDIPLIVDFKKIHNDFSTCRNFDICTKAFSFMAEVIDCYKCDEVILTGRPSTLPGIVSCFRNRLNIPYNRVVSMSTTKMGNWNPFAFKGVMEDPKTSASVGAMLLNICSQSNMENFYLATAGISIKSCIKFLGKLDVTGQKIEKKDVYYANMDLDSDDYQPPLEPGFLVPGQMTLGYRSMPIERWPASPLYKIMIVGDRASAQLNKGIGAAPRVSICRDENYMEDPYKRDELTLKECSAKSDNPDIEPYEVNTEIVMKLCTMPNSAMGENVHWLDSGVIING